MAYKVSVEKRLYQTAIVEIDASSEEEAIRLVQQKIDNGRLVDKDVAWGELMHEYGTFNTTGDVDE